MSKKKKLAALLAAAAITFSSCCPVFAEPDDNTSSTTEPAATETTTAGTSQIASSVYMEDDTLTPPDTDRAEAALIMDMNSGRIIYGKNIDERLFPASTTKMMTGILALESGKMGDTTTATYEALQSITLEDSHMGILIGEQLTMTDLVNGMLVYSANDAANVIAIHVAGSMQAFVDMMNAKAQELGMTGTHFVNACGTHNDDHYTTARDLAILAKYCMQNETFREIVKQPTYHIAPTNKYTQDRYLSSTNLFLGTSRSSYYYSKQYTGIKTGTTSQAGHCLVASAEYNGMNLISVVLKCQDLDVKENAYSYIVTQNLFDFGFNNYYSGVLASPGNIVSDSPVYEAKSNKRVTLTVDKEVSGLIPSGDDISADVQTVTSLPERIDAPISKGDILGTVSYQYRGTEIGSANLVAANDVEQNMILHIFHIVIGIILNPLVFIPVILIIIIAAVARSRKKRRERKRRIQQLKKRKGIEDGHVRTTAPDRKLRTSEMHRTSAKGSNSRYSGDRKRR